MTASRLARTAYRVRQFLRGMRSLLSPDEAARVRALLTDAELRLFLQMEPRDRRQAVDVMHWLERRTQPSDDLLVAALLHDAGKGVLNVWDRVAFVLLEALSPTLVDRLADEYGPRWRRALWMLRHHARLGAELLAAAGTRPRVVELVARHDEPLRAPSAEQDPELRWLMLADDAC